MMSGSAEMNHEELIANYRPEPLIKKIKKMAKKLRKENNISTVAESLDIVCKQAGWKDWQYALYCIKKSAKDGNK